MRRGESISAEITRRLSTGLSRMSIQMKGPGTINPTKTAPRISTEELSITSAYPVTVIPNITEHDVERGNHASDGLATIGERNTQGFTESMKSAGTGGDRNTGSPHRDTERRITE